MITQSLPSERTLSYMAFQAGGTTGDTYNGFAAGSTTATAMTPGIGANGFGIDVTKCNRLKVIVYVGAISTTAVIKAWVSAGNVKADDNSMTQLTGFEIDLTGSSDGAVLVGVIDLRGATANTSTTTTANNALTWLWIEHNGTDATSTIGVELFDFEYEPALDSEATPAPQVVSAYWPSSIAP